MLWITWLKLLLLYSLENILSHPQQDIRIKPGGVKPILTPLQLGVEDTDGKIQLELLFFFILISGFDIQEEAAAPEYSHVPYKLVPFQLAFEFSL